MSDQVPEWLKQEPETVRETERNQQIAKLKARTSEIMKQFDEIVGYDNLKKFVQNLSDDEFVLLQSRLAESENKSFPMETLNTARRDVLKAREDEPRTRE